MNQQQIQHIMEWFFGRKFDADAVLWEDLAFIFNSNRRWVEAVRLRYGDGLPVKLVAKRMRVGKGRIYPLLFEGRSHLGRYCYRFRQFPNLFRE